MNEDAELKQLRAKKDELIKRVLQLRDKLEQKKNSGNKQKKVLLGDDIRERLSREPPPEALPKASNDEERFIVRLVDATQQATGISFQNVDKKWLRDNVWNYTSKVIMKVLKFNLDLTVDLKDGVDNEILDITCRFVKVVDCHLQEITPWVAEFTRAKKMTYLMSAFSEYNDQCIVRQKILDKLNPQKFITVDKCGTGGYTIHIHSPASSKKQYVNFLWTTEFNPKTRAIDHCFKIDGIEGDFVQENQELLEDFCKKGLRKEELETLWSELCTAVNAYEH
ncbi:uncharacterized protein LOC107036492 [Diachasma alloeum]|uniref:uncharacterized protein LOC107036492 n=1 Tax=Diachasma alloeum TaxID=454923 RepID=UPI000738394E|nr:uncharacterized protein LOC107036492 [Diachasma alloeum]